MAQLELLGDDLDLDALLPTSRRTQLNRYMSGNLVSPKIFEFKRSASTRLGHNLSFGLEPPLEWDDLRNSSPDELLSKFHRSSRTTKLFETHQREANAAYVSYAAHVCALYLDVPTFQTSDGRMNVDITDLKSVQFTENPFPFVMGDDIEQFTIYATYDISEESVRRVCEAASEEDECEYVLFRHPTTVEELGENQFLHTIHVFIHRESAEALNIHVTKTRRQSFVAPPLTRGVSIRETDSMTWDRLLAASKIENGLEELSLQFTRKPDVEEAYQVARNERVKNFANVGAKLLTVELGLEGELAEDGRIDCKVPDGLRVHAWTVNMFPYDLAPGIEHFVLFATYTMTPEEIDEVIRLQVPEYETLCYENPPHRKSIPSVWHVQIFAREQTKRRDSFDDVVDIE